MMKWVTIWTVVTFVCILALIAIATNFTEFDQGAGGYMQFVWHILPYVTLAVVGGWLLKHFKKELLQVVQAIRDLIAFTGPARDMAKARVKQLNAATADRTRQSKAQAHLMLAQAKERRARAWQLQHSLPISPQFNSAVYVGDDGIPGMLAGPQPELPAGIQTLHYQNAPRIQGMQQEPVAQIEASQETPEIARPHVDQFYELIPYNSKQTGLGADVKSKQLVIAEIASSTHFKFVGGSGQGKSCVAAGALDIAIHTNDQDHLLIGLLDMEHNTSRLFEDSDHVAELGPRRVRLIGRNPDEVAARIQDLYHELQRRSELGEAHCHQYEPMLLVYVEELLALKFEVSEAFKKQMIDHINVLGVRGRKYDIFLLTCMQTDYSDPAMREGMAQFRTRGAFAIDPDVARASGFYNKELIRQNFEAAIPGRYVLEKPSYSGIVLAMDYDVRRMLENMAAATGATTPATMNRNQSKKSHYETVISEVTNDGHEVTTEATRKQPTTGALEAIQAPLTPQDKRIIQKYRSGMGVSAIVASEFTDSKGKPLTGGVLFTQKAREVQQLIASLLPEVE
jgi:hypothetical protein